MIRYAAAMLGLCACSVAHAQAIQYLLENPQVGAIESGIAVISGWHCQQAAITIQIDGAAPLAVPYGSERTDTRTNCGGRVTTGFSYLFNYNNLPAGAHTIVAAANGVPFATASFTTVNFGTDFLLGRAGEYWVNNFPDFGTRTRLTWQQAKQNFAITGSDTNVQPIAGTFYGAMVATWSGCQTPASNGSFFEIDRFVVTYGTQSLLTLEAANTGQTCTYTGTAFYSAAGGDITVPSGTFTCVTTSGASGGGTWSADRIAFDPVGLLVNISGKYTVAETCQFQGHIGAGR